MVIGWEFIARLLLTWPRRRRKPFDHGDGMPCEDWHP